MRVAMIDPSLFTLPYDQALIAALQTAGHEVTLFGRQPRHDDGEVDGVPLVESFYRVAESKLVMSLPRRVRLAAKGLDHIWSMMRLIRQLRRIAPDVIHFQWLPLPLVDRRMLVVLQGIAPLVLTVHDTNPFNGDPSSGIQTRGLVESFATFDKLVVHTAQGEERLVKQGVPATHLARIPHGSVGPQQAEDDTMKGEITFVLFGKLKPYKGADLLIKAFSAVPEPLRSQARVRIVGKAYMDLEPLRALIREGGIENRCEIESRFVDDAEIPDLFGPGCVAVFPYREIDTSGVLFQAISLSRPIIATRLGTFAELLQAGGGGLLVEREDVASLAGALVRFITDRDFAANCSREAKRLSADAVGWDEVARQTTTVYDAVASRRKAAGSDGTRRATEVSNNVMNTTGGNC